MNVPEIINELTSNITLADLVLFTAGVSLLSYWLVKTSLGRTALIASPPRRNNMPLYLPFVPLLFFFGIYTLADSTRQYLARDLPEWQDAFLDNLFLCVAALASMLVIILLARSTFARRLKGFGLDPHTTPKDLFAAFLNLLTVWPVLLFMIIATILLGKLIYGSDFQMPQHEELVEIMSHPQLSLRILIAVTTIAVMPALEEMLFRGMFQTAIRSFLEARSSARIRPAEMLYARKPQSPITDYHSPITNHQLPVTNHQLPVTNHQSPNTAWAAIAITSALFATIHANPQHWPALFVLSISIGYAYEKSGSLFRPIFIHALFNATSVISVLNQ
jgi:membrane protease YdiL (CAAX protease family)